MVLAIVLPNFNLHSFVFLNGGTVAYCKVLVNNIIVTVSFLQGTNNIRLVLHVSFTMNGIGFWLQCKLLKIILEVYSEIILNFYLEKKMKSWVAYYIVQF